MLGFGPIGPGEETLLGPTQLNARRNRSSACSLVQYRGPGKASQRWLRRTLTSCRPSRT